MEAALIAWVRSRLAPHELVAVGPGDDAAVLRTAGRRDTVVTVDLLSDGVDFQLDRVDPRRVGHKALAVNLSDLAAMAARPMAVWVAVCLPRRGGFEIARQLVDGMLPLAERYGVALAGGDTNSWDGPLVVSVTAMGEVTGSGPLRRDGARPGDRIVVTGALGGSILGRHLDFEPRVCEAMELHARYGLHAGIDISDGLLVDLAHVADASGVGAAVDLPRVPIAEDAHRLALERADGATALDHALGDGEDFELLLAVPPSEAERMLADRPIAAPLTVIGEFVAERGLWRREAGGRFAPLEPRGWRHRFD